ncbi:MAG: GGDEF domain-containing protein [Candidatus Micrarchaeia archaeon]
MEDQKNDGKNDYNLGIMGGGEKEIYEGATMQINIEDIFVKVGEEQKDKMLIKLTEGMGGRIYKIQKREVLIGRREDCDIRLTDQFTSRLHAKIIVSENGTYIQDMGSYNGTFLNFEKVQYAKLSSGDKIIIGRNIIKYIESDDVEFVITEELHKMSIFDPLTEVYNRRYMEKKLEEMFNLFLRYKEPFGVLMIDIDYFKRINDLHGHIVGDFVLKHVSDVLKESLRQTDQIFRYGGEEFCVVLSGVKLQDLSLVADRILKNVRAKPFRDIKVTVSIGGDSVRDGDPAYIQVIQRADEKLYSAKKNGRDQFVI